MSEEIKSVLFVCNMNSVRSPMAAFIFAGEFGDNVAADSAGVYPGWLDPFTEEVMNESGYSMEGYATKRLSDIEPDQFSVVIAMTPEAAGELRRIVDKDKIEYWPIDNPSTETGGRDEVLAAYRGVRDEIIKKINARFSERAQKA